MKENGRPSGQNLGADPASGGLGHLTWETVQPIELAAGLVRASGDALPQVRSPQRAAGLGTTTEQIATIRQAIVRALETILNGMELPVDTLARLTSDYLAETRRDVASATLVAANQALSPHGVVLLDLNLDQVVLLPNLTFDS